MQRTGRKGHAMFRIIVQESRLTPTSGKLVAQLGSYDPHTKTIILDKEKAAFYLEHGAQPSDRVARLLKNNGVKLPSWVKLQDDKERKVRNSDKRRSTAPAALAAPSDHSAPKEEDKPEVAEAETATEEPVEAPVAEEAAEPTEPAEEAIAVEKA